jgi:hypothetical protein
MLYLRLLGGDARCSIKNHYFILISLVLAKRASAYQLENHFQFSSASRGYESLNLRSVMTRQRPVKTRIYQQPVLITWLCATHLFCVFLCLNSQGKIESVKASD